MTMTKFHNKKTGWYDSRKEADRASTLKLLQRAGRISGLEEQVPYVLIPYQRDQNGKLLERECKYIADFVYKDEATGEWVVEDVKSPATKTKEYRIKKKLMLWVHGIRIREV